MARQGANPIVDLRTALSGINGFKADGRKRRPLRVRVLRNYSAEFLKPFLDYHLLAHGIEPTVVFGDFDTVHQDLFAGADGADVHLLSLLLEGIDPDWDLPGSSAEQLASYVIELVDLALQRTTGAVLVNLFLPPLEDGLGAVAALDPASPHGKVRAINQMLSAAFRERAPRLVPLDWERVLMRVGIAAGLDQRMALSAAAPFRHGFLSAYAAEAARGIRASLGMAKKLLVLDCDNTLWGGVVGEAGLEGIALSRTGYPGRAFREFQKAVLRLVDRGVMVALCSKNNLEDVLAVLDQHPDCLLKSTHLVGYRVNWRDKEANIAELVDELNIGMDSVVFVDDSSAECARVRAFLPEVTVLQMPEAPSEIRAFQDFEGLFDRPAVTAEDRDRTQMYQVEASRRRSAGEFASVEEFLASLDLKMTIDRDRTEQAGRIAQLTQKTNQFNLTTRRYVEGDILAMIADPAWAVFAMTVSDRFGEIGLTGVMIVQHEGDDAIVDTLLLSCRALGRRLEHAFVATVFRMLEAWAPQNWRADYIPTAKNAQVADFWPEIGLEAVRSDNGHRQYRASGDVAKFHIPPFVAVTVREGADA